MYKFLIFEFLMFAYFLFKISQIGLFLAKIITILIEIYQKLMLHTKYANSHRFGLKTQQLWFCHFWQLKIQNTHIHSNTCEEINFFKMLILFVIKFSKHCPLSESITIEISKKLYLSENNPHKCKIYNIFSQESH